MYLNTKKLDFIKNVYLMPGSIRFLLIKEGKHGICSKKLDTLPEFSSYFELFNSRVGTRLSA